MRKIWFKHGTLACLLGILALALVLWFVLLAAGLLTGTPLGKEGAAVPLIALMVATMQFVHTITTIRANKRMTMRDRYTELRGEARNFWQYANQAFADFRPENELVDVACKAGIPPGLLEHLRRNRYVNTYTEDVFRNSVPKPSKRQECIWDFSNKLYEEFPQCSLLAKEEFDALNKGRSRLGDFWEVWCGKDDGLGVGYATSHSTYEKDGPEMVILTYLDIHHRAATGQMHRGKVPMYQSAAVLCPSVPD